MLITCRLREILRNMGLKHSWLAKQIGISPTTLSAWIACRSYPDIEKAYQIEEILGISVKEIWVKHAREK